MSHLLQAGAVALAVTVAAVAGGLPAQATTYHAPGITVQVANHGYGSPWWWQHHPRHQVKVCNTIWRHHHRVTVCTMQWKPWK